MAQDVEASSAVRVELDGGRSYEIQFRPHVDIAELMRELDFAPGRCLVVTDLNVGQLYGEAITASLRGAGFAPVIITLPPGETTKSADALFRIYDEALGSGIERRTPIIVVGGGVIGDLGGFAAATLLRGLPLVQVPTTLIAQVDSAIGGKTGINHASGKNLIGAFYQPRAVLTDTTVLQTLPEREWTSGLAEVVKHGLIADPGLFSLLESGWDAVRTRSPELVASIVRRAALVKARVVSEDERESGRRAILNFGHTFAHAIENVAGYGRFTHGEAVAAGMRAALHLSTLHATLDDAARADALVSRIPVPSGLRELRASDLMDAMQTDKKVRGGRLRLILLRRIGTAYAAEDVRREHIESAWDFLQKVVP